MKDGDMIFKSTTREELSRYYKTCLICRISENIRTILIVLWKQYLRLWLNECIYAKHIGSEPEGWGLTESSNEYSIWECADRTVLVWYHIKPLPYIAHFIIKEGH